MAHLHSHKVASQGIERATRLAGRELQRWAPEEGEATLNEGLEEGPSSTMRSSGRWGGVTGWDQFATNKERFQVRQAGMLTLHDKYAKRKGHSCGRLFL